MTKYILVSSLVFSGCTSLYPPPKKAALLVTSPPHQTFLICDADDMTPSMVEMCMRVNNNVEYKDYKFNENLNVNISATGTRTDTVNRSDSSTVSVNK